MAMTKNAYLLEFKSNIKYMIVFRETQMCKAVTPELDAVMPTVQTRSLLKMEHRHQTLLLLANQLEQRSYG